MIYNDKIVSEYGVNNAFIGVEPLSSKPTPTEKDYINGSIVRWFAKRVNNIKAIEIEAVQSTKINLSLYEIISVKWKISGPKDTKIVNGIIERSGVLKENQNEIERIRRERSIDLRATLTNPLEFWRGY